MTDLLWPGDGRAGSLMGDAALLRAMVEVEQAWLDALVAGGVAPSSAKADLSDVVSERDVGAVAAASEGSGNPVVPLVSLLRARVSQDSPEAASWLHRGLTSQDTLDTGLVLCVRDVLDRLRDELRHQVGSLRRLVEEHRGTVMAARTLTQHAVPTTFGVRAAGWLTGVLDAGEGVSWARSGLAVQVGGAAGTLSAAVELAADAQGDPVSAVLEEVERMARHLGLEPSTPWHTARARVTRVGDALVGCTDAWGRIAADVATGSRPEIGELAEPAGEGRGGSSTMPQKRNPVLSVLVRRAALAAPPLAATLHTAAALADDDRPDGAWHAEWATLRSLARRTVVAASQTTELLAGLRVDSQRMRATAAAAADELLSERGSLGVEGRDVEPGAYLGAADAIVDATLARASRFLEDPA